MVAIFIIIRVKQLTVTVNDHVYLRWISTVAVTVDFHCHMDVNFNWLYVRKIKIEVMYEKPRVNEKVERGSTFTFARGFSYVTSILIYARKAS